MSAKVLSDAGSQLEAALECVLALAPSHREDMALLEAVDRSGGYMSTLHCAACMLLCLHCSVFPCQ